MVKETFYIDLDKLISSACQIVFPTLSSIYNYLHNPVDLHNFENGDMELSKPQSTLLSLVFILNCLP